MNRVLKIVLVIFSILYPFAVLAGIVWLNASPRIMVLGLAAIGVVYFLANSGDAKNKGLRGTQFWVLISVVAVLVFLTFLTENIGLLKLYPVVINLFLLASFCYTLFHGPSMIYRFAIVKDKSILESSNKEDIESYCITVTRIWCGFFILNATISAITVFMLNEIIWGLYNGFISYILIGALLGGEYLFRKMKLSR